MLGILIFDQLNDLIYVKNDTNFLRHVQGMAVAQGLASPSEIGSEPAALEANLLVQLFSPLITSHNVMETQFGNPYNSISCEDDTTICLQKYESSVCVVVGRDCEDSLQRLLAVFVRLIKLLVGPCVLAIRENSDRRDLLSLLISRWQSVSGSSQCYLVEAVERLMVGPQVAAAAVQVLSSVLDRIRCPSVTPCHALLLVRNKLLALYSSRSAQELCAGDILLLNLLVAQQSDQQPLEQQQQEATTLQHVTLEQLEGEEAGVVCQSTLLLLKTELSTFTPHLVHYTTLNHNMALVVVSEMGRSRSTGSSLSLLQCVSSLCSGGQYAASVDVCEATLLQTRQLAKRLPHTDNTEALEQCLNKVEQQWQQCKRCDVAKWRSSATAAVAGGSAMPEMPSRLEAGLTALQESIRRLWQCMALHAPPTEALSSAQQAALHAQEKLSSYAEFIDVKAMTNHQYECRALTVNRYMDDFPGLVHFIFVDRSSHLMTAPTLDLPDPPTSDKNGEQDNAFITSCTATRKLTQERVWNMVQCARSHLTAGHHSVMWKDTTFSYAYFLWFEDKHGVAVSPEWLEEDVLSALPLPGIISDDYYRTLQQHCFPGRVGAASEGGLLLQEVMCVHLGLVTAPCVLEQTRRLLSSVAEATACHATQLL